MSLLAPCLHCQKRPGGYARGLCGVCFRIPGAREKYPPLAPTCRRLNGAKLCRHCEEKVASRPRGLCWSCYFTPAIRGQYPVAASRFNSRGVGGNVLGRAPLAEATEALPGSREKAAVLAERARLGQALFHPLDRKFGLS